jgi:peptidyl-prolyl cis-trans isomerase D
MPIMTRMRDNMPLILILLVVAFLITIIFEWGMNYLGLRSGRSDIVGKVDGTKITVQEFNDLTRTLSDQQKARTGQDPTDAEQQRIRDQAWETLITQNLLDRQMKRLGIFVTDKEITDWVYGENPPEDLKRYFIDSTGQFRRETFEDFLRDPNKYIRDPRGNDPNYGTRWLSDYEKNLRQRKLQEKLQTILTASIRVSEGELLQRYLDQTERYEALYASFDANRLVKDSAVTVTEADLRNYYDENRDQYKVEATRTLKYVLFREVPSASDSASRLRDIEEAAAKARRGDDFLELVAAYSDKPDSGVYFHRGELSSAIDDSIFGARVGAVVGPVSDASGYRLFKVLSERTGEKEYVRARHILLPMTGDTMAVKAEAQKLLREAKGGEDFAELAKRYSKDPGSAPMGGDLGWFTKGRMVPAFENAVFKARVGEILGPVRTPFGLHIIKVEGRDRSERKVATISIAIEASMQTKNDLLDRARDFAANARETDLAKEAQGLSLKVQETQVQEKGGVVPGIGVNENITRWAFDNKVGTVSEPFTVPGGHAVFAITEARNEGFKPFEDIQESLKPLVLRKKKIERVTQIAAEVRAKLAPGDSLTKVRDLDPGIPVLETGAFTLSGSIPGVGRDPAFLGTVEALKVGEISPAIEGARGAYLIELLSRSPFDSAAYAAQRETIRSRLLQEKRSRFFSEWLQSLKEKAEIEDHRNLYW